MNGDKNPKKSKFREHVKAFCESSTVHGLIYISNSDYPSIRRIFWAILLMVCTTIFLSEVTQCILLYLSYPVSVKITIKYNDSVIFPAVTICNSNNFRISKMASPMMYDTITEFYTYLGSDKYVNLSDSMAENMTVEYLHGTMGHDMNDMIISCKWKGSNCDENHFKQVLTDYGNCFTFNGMKDGGLNISHTGQSGGLELGLNIQQYEYMAGPDPGAGIKLLVHNYFDLPRVGDFGTYIPPGSHASVGVEVLVVRNLPLPYGQCEDYTNSTRSMCYINCLQEYMVRTCGCRDIYMPNKKESDAVPSCTLDRYQRCAYLTKETFQKSNESCYCPDECYKGSYAQSMSFLDTSEFESIKYLQTQNLTILHDKYILSRQNKFKIEKRLFESDEKVFNNYITNVKHLKIELLKMNETLIKAKNQIQETCEKISQRTEFHDKWGYKKVHYAMKFDFIRGWDIRKERILDSMTVNYITDIKYIQMLLEKSSSNDSQVKFKYNGGGYAIAEEMLYKKIFSAEIAKPLVEEVIYAYENSEALLDFELSPNETYDSYWITEEVVQSSPLYSSGLASQYSEKLLNRIDTFRNISQNILNLVNNVADNEAINITTFNEMREDFEYHCRSISYYKMKYENVLLYPLEYVDRKNNEFLMLNRSMDASFQSVMHQLTDMSTSITNIYRNSLDHLIKGVQAIENYSTGDINRNDLAELFTEEIFTQSIHDLSAYFSESKLLLNELRSFIKNLKANMILLYKNMLQESILFPFYEQIYEDVKANEIDDEKLGIFAEMLNMTKEYVKDNLNELDYRMNADFHTAELANVKSSLKLFFDDINMKLKNSIEFISEEKNLRELIKSIQQDMKQYLRSCELNYDFYKNNIMYVNVYMKQLNYEEIEQQIAYDTTALWCDIGGSIGLFIGASIMSLFEILDAVLAYILDKRRKESSTCTET